MTDDLKRSMFEYYSQRAKEAGLITIGTHITPSEVATFVETDAGAKFLESCRAGEHAHICGTTLS